MGFDEYYRCVGIYTFSRGDSSPISGFGDVQVLGQVKKSHPPRQTCRKACKQVLSLDLFLVDT